MRVPLQLRIAQTTACTPQNLG